MDSDFSEGYGLNSLKLYTKIKYGLRIMHVKYIFDIIQNCGLAAILDVNTLGAVTRTPPTGFLSNLVKRKSLGGPTCIPFIFCLVSKMVTWRPYLFFDPHDNTVLAYYISKIVQDRVFVTIIHILAATREYHGIYIHIDEESYFKVGARFATSLPLGKGGWKPFLFQICLFFWFI